MDDLFSMPCGVTRRKEKPPSAAASFRNALTPDGSEVPGFRPGQAYFLPQFQKSLEIHVRLRIGISHWGQDERIPHRLRPPDGNPPRLAASQSAARDFQKPDDFRVTSGPNPRPPRAGGGTAIYNSSRNASAGTFLDGVAELL